MDLRSLGSTIFAHRLPAVLPLLLLVSACGEPAGAGPVTVRTDLSARSSSEDGWSTIRPGGETVCAGDSEYRFFVRRADPERLLIFFDGGGACWSAETCDPERDRRIHRNVVPSDDPARREGIYSDGIFDLENPENPFADHSMVVVPYCTRDVHLGDREATYTLEDENREERTFTIPHRGRVNAGAALDWVYTTLERPEQIFMAGLSAGAVGLPFHADRVARHYPETRVIGLGVGAAAYADTAIPGIEEERWGLPGVLRRHAGWEAFGAIGTNTLYGTAARGAPNLELYQVDFAHDPGQRRWLRLGGAGDADVLELIRANRSELARATDRFRAFTLGGYEHMLLGFAKFYLYEAGGHGIRDWVAAIASGESVASVECVECDRPGLRYTADDLRLMDRALELLASGDRRDARRKGEGCPEGAGAGDLPCALIQAAREIGELPLDAYPAAHDALYTAFERLGEGPLRGSLTRYDDHGSTGLEDVRSLLTEMRERVASELGTEASPSGAFPEDAPGSSVDTSFVERDSEPFGTFGGVAFVRHTGIFRGETSLGAFRMPYEIVAPEDPALGNGTVLVEPPHFSGGTGRDQVLGREVLFGGGYGYASVGFGEYGFNVLHPDAGKLRIAGGPVDVVSIARPDGTIDEEILVQFAEALRSDGFARDVLGPVDRLYAYGTSQTASVLLELRRAVAGTGGRGLFDFILLHTALWDPPFEADAAFDRLQGDFEPLEGTGRVVFVESEGDLVVSDAEQFRDAVGVPGYRVYEVAGAAHAPRATNPLNHFLVVRAMFVAGDRWVRSGTEPPSSTLLETAPPGEVDPVYGWETGIARDGDLNARGGVRLPDLAVGRKRYVASDSATRPESLPPGVPASFSVLSGSTADLACEPAPGSGTDAPRFCDHEAYVDAFGRQVEELRRRGFLLEADAGALKERAAASEVGEPGSCGPERDI